MVCVLYTVTQSLRIFRVRLIFYAKHMFPLAVPSFLQRASMCRLSRTKNAHPDYLRQYKPAGHSDIPPTVRMRQHIIISVPRVLKCYHKSVTIIGLVFIYQTTCTWAWEALGCHYVSKQINGLIEDSTPSAKCQVSYLARRR